MKLILVHGRAQGGKHPDALTKEWRDALTYGLARASISIPQEVAIVLPYYGNDLDVYVARDRGRRVRLISRGDEEIGEPGALADVQLEILEEIMQGQAQNRKM